MKKRLIMVLMAGVMTLTSAIPAFAAPKQMADGKIFDAEYYAANNQDVVNVLGTDITCGKAEGRLPYDENQLDFTTKAMQKLSFLTFTTKEGLKLNRSLSLVNSSSDDLTISKAKGGEREVTVYVNEKADDGKLILDTCYHMSYPEFYQLYTEGKVQMYSGEAYGIRRADIGTCREQYYTFEAVNKPVYVN